jgi:hypothetical protein
MAFMVLFALGMARIIPWLDDSGQSSSLTITPPASALPATSSLKSRQPQSTEPVRETVIVTPTRSVRLQCAQGPEGGDIAFIVERSEAETGVALLLGAGDSVHDFPVLRP